ncbi:MAG: prepilin-type N-terminal cleavage/methylation domain-containing protein [Acidobacteriia bacterium]|nr:prepilin-type N-terminal cleavage/methylation domain-containing protein [Terriglobia bacterium]
MRFDRRGFSLVELLVVVSIILIIAAIAIPNLMRSRMSANQASTVESLRVINTSEVAYSVTYTGYSPSLAALGPPPPGAAVTAAKAGLIDQQLAGGLKSGYIFTYTPTQLDANGQYRGYTINANPSQYNVTGVNYYYTDQSHVIRQNATQPASATDEAVAQ